MFSNPLATAEGLQRFSPLVWARYIVWALVSFVSAWIKSRRIICLLMGLPAIISVMVMLAANARTGEVMPISVRQQYLEATTDAIDKLSTADDEELRSKLVDEAEFYLQRLEEGGDTSEERLWQRTRLDAFVGRSQRRWDDLHAILSDQEQLRDVDAHLEIASGLLTGEWDAPDLIDTAESHLEQVIRISTSPAKTIAARRGLADLYILLERLEDARDQLEQIASVIPEERLRLATVYQDLRDEERAASHATSVIPQFRDRVDAGSTDPNDWQHLADAYFLSGDHQAAIDVLERATTLPGHEIEFRRMLARFYVLWSRRIPESDLSRRLELLEQALNAFPSDEFVLAALLQFMLTSDQAAGDQIEAELLEVLESGEAPVIVHTIIGSRAALNGDAERAQLHLNLALQQGDTTSQVLNNLAYVLAFGPQHDYVTALTLIDQALAKESHPRMHDTRGQILARLHRWPEAIAALEIALRDMPDYAPIRQTLAEAYQAVGAPDVAAIHEQRLEELGGPVSLDFAVPEEVGDSPVLVPEDSPSPSADGSDSEADPNSVLDSPSLPLLE